MWEEGAPAPDAAAGAAVADAAVPEADTPEEDLPLLDPAVPEAEPPNVPEVFEAEAPVIGEADLPDDAIPEVAAPEVPEVFEAEAPVIGEPDLPEEAAPQIPTFVEPDVSGVSEPQTPDAAPAASWGAPQSEPAPPPPAMPDQPVAQPQAGGWGQGSPQLPVYQSPTAPDYTQQQMYQAAAQHQPPAASPGPKKKGKGLLIFLIILALVLAGAFIWGLTSNLSARSSAAAQPPVVAEVEAEEEATSEPTEADEEEPAEPVADEDASEVVDVSEPELSEAEPQDLDSLAREAGLGELLDFYNEFDSNPVSIAGGATLLGQADKAELTTIFVGPAGIVSAQEVGTITVSEPVLGWSDSTATDICPDPQEGTEYIKVTVAANTGPALQDYPFSGIEIKFFDEAGEQTGVGNMVLTELCFGDIGAVATAWKRSGAYSGGLLAQVTPGTTSVAYSAQWGYGIDDTVYQWNLADL